MADFIDGLLADVAPTIAPFIAQYPVIVTVVVTGEDGIGLGHRSFANPRWEAGAEWAARANAYEGVTVARMLAPSETLEDAISAGDVECERLQAAQPGCGRERT